MNTVDKIAVFDLDGTLWKVNSHYEILNKYYNTAYWTSFMFRLYACCFPENAVRKRDVFYSKIPESFINSMSFEFNEKVVGLLRKKESEGFKVLIISNAPTECIVRNASDRLGCNYLTAKVGEKVLELKRYYRYQSLFVCTDNTTDVDLLREADSYRIIHNSLFSTLKFLSKGYV